MRALLAGLIFAVMPAEAQWKLPDIIAPLREGAAVCNDAGTHCLVNQSDLMSDKLAIMLASRELNRQAAEISELREKLAAEVARKSIRRADVKPERKS